MHPKSLLSEFKNENSISNCKVVYPMIYAFGDKLAATATLKSRTNEYIVSKIKNIFATVVIRHIISVRLFPFSIQGHIIKIYYFIGKIKKNVFI